MVSAIIAVILARIAVGGKRRKSVRHFGWVLWSSLIWGLAATAPALWMSSRAVGHVTLWIFDTWDISSREGSEAAMVLTDIALDSVFVIGFAMASTVAFLMLTARWWLEDRRPAFRVTGR